MRSMPWRNSSMLKKPRAPPARWIASTAASHAAWKTGSFSSRSTGPKPCMPPRSCTPSMPAILSTGVRSYNPTFSVGSVDLGGREVGRRGLGGDAGVAGAQVHPEDEAGPVGRVHVPPADGVDPRIRQEDGQHLLVAPVPQAQAPRARPPGPVAALEERGAAAAAPLRQRGRRGQAGRAPVGADAEVEVPGLAALELHRDVTVQQRHAGPGREAPLEHRALDARAEDDVLPVLLEDLPQQREQRGLRALAREVLGAAAVQVLLHGHRVTAQGTPPSRPRARADPRARARESSWERGAGCAGSRAGARRSTRGLPPRSPIPAAAGRSGPGSPGASRPAGCARPAG